MKYQELSLKIRTFLYLKVSFSCHFILIIYIWMLNQALIKSLSQKRNIILRMNAWFNFFKVTVNHTNLPENNGKLEYQKTIF